MALAITPTVHCASGAIVPLPTLVFDDPLEAGEAMADLTEQVAEFEGPDGYVDWDLQEVEV